MASPKRIIGDFFRGIGYGFSSVFGWFGDYFKDIGTSASNTGKNIVVSAFVWVIVAGLALCTATGIMMWNTIDARKDQQMNKYWQNNSEMSYRQMSVFGKGYGAGTEPKHAQDGNPEYLTLKSIETIRENLENKVSENAKKNNKPDKNNKKKLDKKTQSNWTDCYSTFFDASCAYEFDQTINGETSTKSVPFNANIVAVGGNYKAFHPFEFLSGGFLPADEFDLNICVINDNLAWTLFRSYDIAGRKINILGDEYQIIGVVAENSTSIDKLTGAQANRIYCYYSKMEALNQKGYFNMGSFEEGQLIDPLAILCYEAMLPEIVSGVAKSDVLSSLPTYNASNPQFVVVSNTGRFNPINVYKENMPIGSSEQKYGSFMFPYWEKAARLSTERLFIEGILFIIGVILIFIGIIITVLRFSKKIQKSVREPEVGDLIFDGE